MESIISNEKKCFMCGTDQDLHKHHILYGTANRIQSEKYGCWCWLCGRHHNMSDRGIHFDKEFDLYMRRMAQERFERKYGHDLFMKVFGRNYL